MGNNPYRELFNPADGEKKVAHIYFSIIDKVPPEHQELLGQAFDEAMHDCLKIMLAEIDSHPDYVVLTN